MSRLPIIASIAIFMAGVGVAAATSPDPGPPPREEPRETQTPGPPQERPDKAALSPAAPVLAPFRRQRALEDSVPAIYRGPLTENLDVDSARRVQLSVGRSAWLIPGSRGRACVLTAAAVNCVDSDDLLGKGFLPSISWRRGEPVHLAGLAADGAGAVEVKLADGRRVSATPEENVVAAELPAAIASITWTGPQGPESLTLPAHQREEMQAVVQAPRTP